MKTNRIIIGTITVLVSLFLAWRIGLWLEPTPAEKGALSTPLYTAKEPAFATGKVRDDLPYELRNVKAAEGGKNVAGLGIVRFDIGRGDIKPVVIALLKVVKKKFPAAQQIALDLTPSVNCPDCRIAEARYDNGRVNLAYGTPTLAQIEESNRQIGQPASGETDNRPLLFQPNGEAFSAGLIVMTAIEAARGKNPALSDEQLLDAAAASTGLSYVVVKRNRDFMKTYYSGDGFGSESFDL